MGQRFCEVLNLCAFGTSVCGPQNRRPPMTPPFLKAIVSAFFLKIYLAFLTAIILAVLMAIFLAFEDNFGLY